MNTDKRALGAQTAFSGRVLIEQSWREVAWPMAAVGTPAAVALAAWWASGSPRAMVLTGTAVGVVALVVDYRHKAPRPTLAADQAADVAPPIDPIEPTEPVEPVERVRLWGWSCARCVIDAPALFDQGEADQLAGTHDDLHHGGRPTAWVCRPGPHDTAEAA